MSIITVVDSCVHTNIHAQPLVGSVFVLWLLGMTSQIPLGKKKGKKKIQCGMNVEAVTDDGYDICDSDMFALSLVCQDEIIC